MRLKRGLDVREWMLLLCILEVVARGIVPSDLLCEWDLRWTYTKCS